VLAEVLIRDTSPATAAALLPYLHAAVDATTGTDQELNCGFVYARALGRLRPGEATTQLHRLLDTAHHRGDYAMASVIASELINRYRGAGRYQDALTLSDQMPEDHRRAGYGPWTQLTDEAQRLQILRAMGHNQQVLDAVEDLRNRMATLPDPPDQPETVQPWNVRETVLGIGMLAARDLELWQGALDLNAEQVASKRARGAPDREIAFTRFNDYGPLAALGRLGDARTLLLQCREVFQAEHDIAMLGKTLSALADIEDKLGHGQAAIDLEHNALRLEYTAGDIPAIAVSHYNLANYLDRHSTGPNRNSQIWAHQIADAIIEYQTSSGGLRQSLASIARLLQRRPDGEPPASFDQVCAIVGRIDGVDLAALVDRLPHHAPDGQTAMTEVLTLARQLPADDAPDLDRHLRHWEPVISALAATTSDAAPAHAAAGDSAQVPPAATDFLDQALDHYADSTDWAGLVAALRRVRAGERDRAALTEGLDEIDTAILTRALAALDGSHPIDPLLWATDPDNGGGEDGDQDFDRFLAAVVAAAHGDPDAAAAVSAVLDEMATDPESAALASALRAISTGNRHPAVNGLDEDGQALIAQVLAAIGGDTADTGTPDPTAATVAASGASHPPGIQRSTADDQQPAHPATPDPGDRR